MKRFHAFALDTTNQCLWRGNDRVVLPPKAFDLLRYLVDHADRLVTQEEILEALWTDTFVNHEVVKKYILGIRKALGDRRETPVFIRTFPKRGYQFIAPISDDRGVSSTRSGEPARPLIDRSAPRARLESCLQHALRGDRQIVFIEGEPGVGKTTFVDQFVREVSSLRDFWIARGHSVEGFASQEPYYPWLMAFEQLVRASDGQFVQTLAKRAPTWLLQFPSLVEVGQAETLRRDTFGATRDRMVRELCETLDAVTRDRTLVLVLEDLHWADPSTLDVISSCARRPGPSRLLLIGTLRPTPGISPSALSRLRQDLAIHELCRDITLESFDPKEVATYLSLIVGPVEFANDLGRVIHRHSAGNPLFMTALVRDFIANGILARDGAEWKVTVPVERIDPAVPLTLQELLDVQFDQLTDSEQRVLRRASAIGERFPAWAVADGTADLDSVEGICERLAERRLFIRASDMGPLEDGTPVAFYQFHHALYRQAVYRRLSEVTRARAHRSIGERLETLFGPSTPALAAELALHFEKSHQYDRAITYLQLTARNAERRFAVRESIELLQRALALVPRLPEDRRPALEIQLLESIGDAHYVLGAMVESALAYETESAVSVRFGLTAAQVQAQSCLARPLGLLDPDRAIATLRDAATVGAGLDNRQMQARIELLAAGTRLLYDAWCADDVSICEESYGVVSSGGHPTPPGFERMIYAHVQSLRGDGAAALANAQAAIPRVHEQATDVMVHLFALSAQILALLQLGRFGQALEIIRSNQKLAERNGSDPWLFTYREAWLRLLAQDFQGARRVCEELKRSSVYPTGQAETIGRLASGFEALDHRRWDEARRHFDKVRDPNQTPKFFIHWYWRMHAHVGLVRACLGSAHFADARIEAERLTETAVKCAEPNLQALAWDASAQVAIAESDWTHAAEGVQRALTALSRSHVPISSWQIHATASELFRHVGRAEDSAVQRERAQAHIAAIAGSFAPDEPLKAAWSAAASARLAGAPRVASAVESGRHRKRH